MAIFCLLSFDHNQEQWNRHETELNRQTEQTKNNKWPLMTESHLENDKQISEVRNNTHSHCNIGKARTAVCKYHRKRIKRKTKQIDET